ncbi:MAG: hypothetical protein HC822_26785 [Oscillochloris sp.]|nr:hypothetical protein [Oscillochloris sp.]
MSLIRNPRRWIRHIVGIVVFICTIGFVAQPPQAIAQSSALPQLYDAGSLVKKIVKWDPASGAAHQYSLTIPSNQTMIIAVAVLSTPAFTPAIVIPAQAGCTVSQAVSRSAVAFCSGGTAGSYTVEVAKSNGQNPDAAYAVLALSTNDGSTSGATGVQGTANKELNALSVDMYNIDNLSSSVRTRQMILLAAKVVENGNTTTNLAFAAMFREDGTLACSSWGNRICDLYDEDENFNDYHLVMFNADNVTIRYALTLRS